MKQVKWLLFAATAIALFQSCEKIVGEGPVITQQRTTGNYSGIEIYTPADVDYTEDSTYELEIEAQQNILNIIESYVHNDRLILKFNNNHVTTTAPIKVHIHSPGVNAFTLSGSGSLNVLTPLHPENLDLALSGSGNIHLDELYTNDIDARISGSGNIEVKSGTADDETLDISGSGNIDLLEVKAHDAKTISSGSGIMKVQVDKTLKVTISGSGKVYYKGSPSVTADISGSGSVIKL